MFHHRIIWATFYYQEPVIDLMQIMDEAVGEESSLCSDLLFQKDKRVRW